MPDGQTPTLEETTRLLESLPEQSVTVVITLWASPRRHWSVHLTQWNRIGLSREAEYRAEHLDLATAQYTAYQNFQNGDAHWKKGDPL